MNEFNENNQNSEEKKEYFSFPIIIVLVVGIVFTSLGLWLAFSSDDTGTRVGGFFFAGMSAGIVYLGLYGSVGQMIYDKHPWKTEKIFLVKKVIPICEENREELYEMYSIDSDEHDTYQAENLNKLIKCNDGIQRYAVGVIMYGKFKRNTFRIEDFKRIKAITQSYIYETTSNRFEVDQLYVLDITKYEVNFFINQYKEEDFEFLGQLQ